ncbi:hypothetical protein J4217_02330 [Candidatus Pacearchaeota archaeon]|nr:hypothetical protein [Candidatus Pacearchaeota archaeon]
MGINKRGISGVVITVLLILITISAFFVLANTVVPFVRDNLKKSTECTPYASYFKFQEVFNYQGNNFRFNCYDESGFYGISVKNLGTNKLGAEEPAGLAIVLSDGANKNVINITGSAEIDINRLRMLDSSKTNFIIPERGGIQTYVYNASVTGYNSMEVYPVLRSGRICEKTDEIKIIKCTDNINLE